jgi:hypothetical protein
MDIAGRVGAVIRNCYAGHLGVNFAELYGRILFERESEYICWMVKGEVSTDDLPLPEDGVWTLKGDRHGCTLRFPKTDVTECTGNDRMFVCRLDNNITNAVNRLKCYIDTATGADKAMDACWRY